MRLLLADAMLQVSGHRRQIGFQASTTRRSKAPKKNVKKSQQNV